jgi:hypothetical protein
MTDARHETRATATYLRYCTTMYCVYGKRAEDVAVMDLLPSSAQGPVLRKCVVHTMFLSCLLHFYSTTTVHAIDSIYCSINTGCVRTAKTSSGCRTYRHKVQGPRSHECEPEEGKRIPNICLYSRYGTILQDDKSTVPFGSNHNFTTSVRLFSTYAICVAYGSDDVIK